MARKKIEICVQIHKPEAPCVKYVQHTRRAAAKKCKFKFITLTQPVKMLCMNGFSEWRSKQRIIRTYCDVFIFNFPLYNLANVEYIYSCAGASDVGTKIGG